MKKVKMKKHSKGAGKRENKRSRLLHMWTNVWYEKQLYIQKHYISVAIHKNNNNNNSMQWKENEGE